MNYNHDTQRNNHSMTRKETIITAILLIAFGAVLQPFYGLYLSCDGECDGTHENGFLSNAVVEFVSHYQSPRYS